MVYKIVDTTLRDGEQKAGIAYEAEEKIKIAKHLDSMGIYQIEAGIPAMGGEEKQSIKEIMKLGLNSKISAWNRLNIEDIRHSMDCGVDIIHISAPASDMHIIQKLRKSRGWVISQLSQCIEFIKREGFKVSVGMEDATRADFIFIAEILSLCENKGVEMIRYADTLGISTPSMIFPEIKKIKQLFDVNIEIHAHNDFGMAIANSAAAAAAGAEYIDCTLGGIGERAGNCDYYGFTKLMAEL
ncbi:2-isopropylmalate synthase [Oxobacter pfennigii]|uniref:2-isopropylmalate synthase n=1 Tax=Oxobacter pfennigii TaxID=36849 RepID=A0A0P8WAQ0_9CLOT|nr:homocitrate synthase [Oxobacter pfennigii]KPU45698.1 2-isopropylmalate synthase [Oxobacter pfennigii]